MIGCLIGILFGALCAFVIFLLNLSGVHQLGEQQYAIIAMVGCGVLGACLTATTLGTFSPFFFSRMGVDPAVASGPIVTAFNDVLSTLMFFLVARLIYSVF